MTTFLTRVRPSVFSSTPFYFSLFFSLLKDFSRWITKSRPRSHTCCGTSFDSRSQIWWLISELAHYSRASSEWSMVEFHPFRYGIWLVWWDRAASDSSPCGDTRFSLERLLWLFLIYLYIYILTESADEPSAINYAPATAIELSGRPATHAIHTHPTHPSITVSMITELYRVSLASPAARYTTP